jgi:hypothetical protein
MVATSFWYVSLAPPATIAAAKEAIAGVVDRLRQDPEFDGWWEEWRATPEAVHGPGPGGGTASPAAVRLLDGFRQLELTEAQLLALSVPETEATTWDLGGDRPDPCDGLFAAARGIPITSLLMMGLGPLRSSWLPGAFGMFALSGDEVAEAADGIRRAHAMSPADRASSLARMHDWLSMGDDHSLPVQHLLEALPDVAASAVARSTGMISIAARAA